jgi:hypothetical protein
MGNLKFMKKSTVFLIVSLLLGQFVGLQFGFVPIVKAEAGSVIATSGSSYLDTFYRNVFYANGRFWAFYSNGTYAFYESTTDPSDWSETVTNIGACTGGYDLGVCFNETHIHYVRWSNDDVFYREGTPQSDGNITWSAVEQTVYDGNGTDFYDRTSITVDSNGYAWIGAIYLSGGVCLPYVLKNAENDGTWSTDFAYELNSSSSTSWRARPVPLTAGKVYVIYWYIGSRSYGRLYDAGWGSVEEDLGDYNVNGYYQLSAVAENDDVHLVYIRASAYQIRYNKRTYGVGWAASDVLVQDSMAITQTPSLSIDTLTGDLYCFWLDTVTDHVYYKKCVSGDWDVDPTDWIDESADGITSNLLESFYQFYNGYAGLLYITKSSSPYDIKFAYLTTEEDATSPTFMLPSPSYNSTQAGQPCQLNCQWNDNVNMSMALFSHNNTGAWSYNNTATLVFSNATAAWANYTVTLNSTAGQVMGYYWIANDTSNNWNVSMEIQTLTITTGDYYQYVTQQSDEDSKADVGTHSNFNAQKDADWTNDTLIEANTNTTRFNESENFVDNNSSDVDSSANKGASSNFTALQYYDGVYDTLTEENMGGGEGDPTWWDGDWTYRKSVTIEAGVGAETDYQMQLIAHYGSGEDDENHVYCNSHCQTDFDDLRFTDDDNETLLDYWLETKVNSDSATFWVKVNDDLDSDALIFIYYGNAGASSLSNGTATFPDLFTHFEGDSLPDGWTEDGTDFGSMVIEDSQLKLTGQAASSGSWIQRGVKTTTAIWDPNTALMYRITAINYYDTSNKHLMYAGGEYPNWYIEFYSYEDKINVRDYNVIDYYSPANWELCEQVVWFGMEAGNAGNAYYYVNNTWIDTLNGTGLNPSKSFPSMTIYFKLRVGGGTIDAADYIYIDWVAIRKFTANVPWFNIYGDEEENSGGANYNLDLEFQWTIVDYDEGNEYLCINTGTQDAEALKLQVWDGAWQELSADLSASGWNNFSVSSYLTSETLTIRFLGGTETSDTTQSTWQIECSLIHVWSVGVNYELDLEEQFTSANFSRTYVELCVRMGDFNTTEDLALDYWNASAEAWIQVSAALTEDDWTNSSVKAYTSNASVTFTIRFRGTAESGDEERSAWNKDACLLHTWDVAGNVETIVSFASLNFSSGNTESESITKTFNAVLSFSSSTLKTITKPLYTSASLSFSANSIVSVSQTLSIIASALVSFSTAILNTFSKTLTGNAPLSFSPSNTKTASFPVAGEATMTFSANHIATETVSLINSAGLSFASAITKTFSGTLTKSANLGLLTGNIRTLAFSETASATLTFTANHVFSETKSMVQSAGLTFASASIQTLTETITKSASLSFLTETIKTFTFSKTTSASMSFLTYHGVSPIANIVQSASLTFTSGMGKTIAKSLITSANLGFLTGNVRSFTLSRIASASLSFTTGNIISSLRLISIIQSASLSFQTGIIKSFSTSLVKTATLTFTASNIQALQTSLVKSASLNFLTGKIATSLISLQKGSTLTFLTDNQKQITFPIAPYASLSLSPFNIKTINFPITSFATLSLMANSVVSAVQNVLNIISSASLSFASSIITSFTITKTMSSTLQLGTFNMKTLTMPITANAPLSFAAQGIVSALQNVLSITSSAILSFLSGMIETTTITRTSSATLTFSSAISKTLTKPLINHATLSFLSSKILTPIPNLVKSATLTFSTGNIQSTLISKMMSATLSFTPSQLKTLSLPITKSVSLSFTSDNLQAIAQSLVKSASLGLATATDKFITLPITSSASLIFSTLSQVSASAYGVINIMASAILHFQVYGLPNTMVPLSWATDTALEYGFLFGALSILISFTFLIVQKKKQSSPVQHA